MTKMPPSFSLVSAKGPSWISGLPLRAVTVVVATTDSSTSVPISTPAADRSSAYCWNAAMAGAMSSSVNPTSVPSW